MLWLCYCAEHSTPHQYQEENRADQGGILCPPPVYSTWNSPLAQTEGSHDKGTLGLGQPSSSSEESRGKRHSGLLLDLLSPNRQHKSVALP
jgi:hypothetical protein